MGTAAHARAITRAARALALLEMGESGDLSGRTPVLTALLKLYAGGRCYLNFYGPAGTIETIPFHELLQHGGERVTRRQGRVRRRGASSL
jgi:hypothetical protein